MNSLIQCVDLQTIENAFFDNRIFSYILLYTHSFTIEKHTLTYHASLASELKAQLYKGNSQLFITFANAKTKLNCIYLNISTGNVV